jgi:hypothetical protein
MHGIYLGSLKNGKHMTQLCLMKNFVDPGLLLRRDYDRKRAGLQAESASNARQQPIYPGQGTSVRAKRRHQGTTWSSGM